MKPQRASPPFWRILPLGLFLAATGFLLLPTRAQEIPPPAPSRIEGTIQAPATQKAGGNNEEQSTTWANNTWGGWDSKSTFAVMSLAITLISLGLAIKVYRANNTHKKRDRALALLQSLMTSEFLVKARLISQELLLNHQSFEGKNYLEIDEALVGTADADKRAYIRAIPNFFRTVDLAYKHDYIPQDENIFVEVYTWYWEHIMKPRCGKLEADPMFREHKWMLRNPGGPVPEQTSRPPMAAYSPSSTDNHQWSWNMRRAVVADILGGRTTVAEVSQTHQLDLAEINRWVEDLAPAAGAPHAGPSVENLLARIEELSRKIKALEAHRDPAPANVPASSVTEAAR